MKKTIALGTAMLVAMNVIASAVYSFLWPYLDDLNLISWGWNWRLLGEIVLFALIIGIFGWFFCKWYARRIEKDIRQMRDL